MRTTATLVLLSLCLSIGLVAADWNILSFLNSNRDGNTLKNTAEKLPGLGEDDDVVMSLEQYCESWRMNVELNNIRGYEVVPGECTSYIGDYMTSEQYKVDIHGATEQAILFLTTSFQLSGDGKDAWIFDIDEVLLSTVPFYSKYQYGGIKVNKTDYEDWLAEAKAPALDHMPHLFHFIRTHGLKIFIISTRPENLREATVENLVNATYYGWSELILRTPDDNYGTAEKYKAEQRSKLVQEGHHLWGIVGSQWSTLGGYTNARRNFKLPNPMYYEY